MPYIDQKFRSKVALCGSGAAGELNYELTMVVRRYLRRKGLSYQTCNDIVGALDNAKDEFRRRIQHPYEDGKLKTNGDVY